MISHALRAVVFGTTGAAGGEVVRQCLNDPRIAEVAAVTRRPLAVRHGKLREVICGDFLNLAPIADHVTDRDVCFYCLGVSQLQEKDPARYREITHHYTLEAARVLLERSPDHTFHFLSGRGANPSGESPLLFARVKGETERDLAALPIPKLVIWRPGYIYPVVPRNDSPLLYDRLLSPAYPLIRRLFPGLATDTVRLARAMLQATFEARREGVVGNREIGEIAKRFRVPSHIPSGG